MCETHAELRSRTSLW